MLYLACTLLEEKKYHPILKTQKVQTPTISRAYFLLPPLTECYPSTLCKQII